MRTLVHALIFTAVASVFADASVDSLLTLSGSVEYAVANGLSLRTALNRMRAVDNELIAAKNALLPSARASLSTSGTIDPVRQIDAGASVGVDYRFAPADYTNCRAAMWQARAVASDTEQLRKDVAAAVVIQFTKAVGMLRLIDVEAANIDYQMEKSAEVEALFQAGRNARSDVLQQRSNLAEARARRITAVQNHQREKLALLDLLGLPLQSGRFLLDTSGVLLLVNRCATLPSEHSFSGLPETDAVTAQRIRVAVEEAKLAAARLSYVPELSLSAGWSASDQLTASAAAAAGQGSGATTSLRAGASIDIPLFDRRQRWLKVKNAETSVQSELLALEKLQQSNDLAVARAALDDAMALERIAADRARFDAANEALAAVEERYRAGASTLIDLNAVRATWLEAHSALVQAQFDRVVSTVTLLYQTGRFEQVAGLIDGETAPAAPEYIPEKKEPTMSKKLVTGIVVLVLIVGAGVGFRLRHRPLGAHGTEYTTAKIERGDIVNSITSTGTLEPVSVVEVGTQVSGILDKVYVDFNDTVTRGQIIAELDRTFLSGALDEAMATRNRAQALFDLAKAEYERNEPLFKKGFLSDQEFAKIRTDFVSQQATLQSAEAAVKKARINLQYATITSPITGTVIGRNIEVGQTVAASFSAPTLFIIAEDLKRMQILASVDEADIGVIRQGQVVQFTVQAFPESKFEGRVGQIRLQPTVSQNVVTYTVVITTDNGDGTLLPGMTATVDFIIEKVSGVLKIPNAALRFKPASDSLLKSALRQRGGVAGDRRQRQEGFSPGRSRQGDRPGSEGRPAPDVQGRAMVWFMGPEGQLRPVFIRTGITDGIVSELVKGEDVDEGTAIITGTKTPDKKTKKKVSLLPQPGPPGRGR